MPANYKHQNTTCLWMKKRTVHVRASWKEFTSSLFRCRCSGTWKPWRSWHVNRHYTNRHHLNDHFTHEPWLGGWFILWSTCCERRPLWIITAGLYRHWPYALHAGSNPGQTAFTVQWMTYFSGSRNWTSVDQVPAVTVDNYSTTSIQRVAFQTYLVGRSPLVFFIQLSQMKIFGGKWCTYSRGRWPFIHPITSVKLKAQTPAKEIMHWPHPVFTHRQTPDERESTRREPYELSTIQQLVCLISLHWPMLISNR